MQRLTLDYKFLRLLLLTALGFVLFLELIPPRGKTLIEIYGAEAAPRNARLLWFTKR